MEETATRTGAKEEGTQKVPLLKRLSAKFSNLKQALKDTKGNAPQLKRNAKNLLRHLISLKYVNIALTCGVLILIGLSVAYASSHGYNATDLETKTAPLHQGYRRSVSDLGHLRPMTHYVKSVRKRNIFKPYAVPVVVHKAKKVVVKGIQGAAQLRAIMAHLDLIGLGTSKEKGAAPHVFVRDSRTGKTFMARQGEQLAETGAKVAEVGNRGVILSYKAASAILQWKKKK